MATITGKICGEVEDGTGWGGLVETKAEREARKEHRAEMLKHYANGLEDGRKDENERCAAPLPAAVVLQIKNECRALGLDDVAFAWRAHGATELSRLRGERLVLLELLSEAADVIHNLPDEVETQEEADRINALKDRIADARGAVLLELGPPVK